MFVSRRPSGSGAVRLESCLILQILNEDSKCSELRVAVCKAYFTKESELPSTSVSLFNLVISGSNPGSDPDYYPGQWY